MFSHRFASALRAAPALSLAAAVMVSAVGPPSSVGAAPPLEPEAQIQIVLLGAHIYDDRDWGSGEMVLEVKFICHSVSAACPGAPNTLDQYEARFSGDSGETVPFDDLVLPRSREKMEPSYDASAETGYPLFPGHRYQLTFYMYEDDPGDATSECMGSRQIVLSHENGWALGTHRLRSTSSDGSGWGDYQIEFEVRRAPLPDLRPVNITVHDLPGSPRKLVCTSVQNVEAVDAGPFEVAVKVDGVVPPGGRITAGRLASGDAGDLCVEVALPTSGQHTLAAVVDEPRTSIEFGETNNVYERPYQGTGPTAAPAPTPSSALSDLTVSAIKVNDRVPDGKDDCKDGRNDVTVVVKNAGAADAGGFVVRLVADGDDDDAKEKLVADLDAGREREVRFDEVRLRKGERTLTAVDDGNNVVAESKEDNNERTATATCKDA